MPRPRALREDVFRAADEIASGFAGASTLDLTDQFCSADACPAVLGGLIVYGDPGHIANGFARSLAGVIAQRIVPAVTQGNGGKLALAQPRS